MYAEGKLARIHNETNQYGQQKKEEVLTKRKMLERETKKEKKSEKKIKRLYNINKQRQRRQMVKIESEEDRR